jgi:hypothetical protein
MTEARNRTAIRPFDLRAFLGHADTGMTVEKYDKNQLHRLQRKDRGSPFAAGCGVAGQAANQRREVDRPAMSLRAARMGRPRARYLTEFVGFA